MKIVIIGGTGLLSTSVAQQLIDRGDEVTLINRGRTPSRLVGRFRQWVGDLQEAEAVAALIRRDGAWDGVVDMISGTLERASRVAAACAGLTRQLIFCSSSNVYPKPASHYPVREEHPLGATFASGIGKIHCEDFYREAERRGDFALTVIRPGHIYGETGGVLHSLGQVAGFLDRLRLGKPVVVHGEGTGLWSALHAEDIASLFVAAAGNPVAFGGTYNAMGEEWMTWDQYHERLAQAMGIAGSPLIHVPVAVLGDIAGSNADQVRRSLQFPGLYDMARAQRDFGWKQTISFVDGMRRTIRWLAEHDRLEAWDASPEYEQILAAWQAWRNGKCKCRSGDGRRRRRDLGGLAHHDWLLAQGRGTTVRGCRGQSKARRNNKPGKIPTPVAPLADSRNAAATSLGLTRKHVDLAGRRLSYFFREGRPCLALVPGSFQDFRQWFEVIDRLDRHLGLVVVDLPGHGESDKWQGEASVEQFALDVWSTLDICGFGGAIYLGGHSIGGMIALEMGRARPTAVNGIISLEAWTNSRVATEAFAGQMYNTLSPELLARQAYLRAHSTPGLSDEDRHAFSQAWTCWDGTAFLQSTTIPILELWGDRGRPRPTLAQLHLPERESISVKWLANASHNLPLERPVEVAQAILHFIHRR